MKPSAKMGLTLNPSVLTTTTTMTSQISATTKTPTWIRRFARGAFTSSTILRRKETSKVRRSVARNDASLFQATDSRRRPSQRRRRTTPASKTAKRFLSATGRGSSTSSSCVSAAARSFIRMLFKVTMFDLLNFF